MLLNAIADGCFDFPKEAWRHISGAAKDLISRMLVRAEDVGDGRGVDEENVIHSTVVSPTLQRISAKDVLLHPWVRDAQAPATPLRTAEKLRDR